MCKARQKSNQCKSEFRTNSVEQTSWRMNCVFMSERNANSLLTSSVTNVKGFQHFTISLDSLSVSLLYILLCCVSERYELQLVHKICPLILFYCNYQWTERLIILFSMFMDGVQWNLIMFSYTTSSIKSPETSEFNSRRNSVAHSARD